ncbi:hypothetical protein Esi_0349_0007 [Ectocarpus siliculosus]|uniref:Uncharacterized protein n=1 Tax=Ectocarpus siliculosus TaxID=2880 RepID=D7FYR0_ECTSI|nr:hypothetical protein Esi_0349_0007 [Ectocarpus siliculosus]|eukprot:CBJ32587.1 hypothetical protein Esi_0349_0007 [Ectocarpus siliculosus]
MAREVEVGSQAAETTKPVKEAGASPLSSSKVAEAVAAPAAGAMVTEVLQLDKNASIELGEALPNREEAEASSANSSEIILLGGGAARAGGTKAPEISKPARSSTRRAAVKLAEERRLKKATKQREARQRKKDRRAEGSRQDASARQDEEAAIRHQHDLDMAITAAAAWQERLAEIQRNVAVGRAQQQAREGERERAAAAIQAALIKAVARRRCLRPYAVRAMQADKAATESRAQRRERERVGAAAAVIQATWGRPAVRTRCRRAYTLRTGERDRRKWGARVIRAACYAYGVARRTAEQPSPETQKSAAAEKKSTATKDTTAAEVVGTTSLTNREEGGKEGSMTAVVEAKRKEVDELLLAKAEHALKEDRAREGAATERESADPAGTKVARPAETRASLEPPKPRRQHITAAPSTPLPPAGPSTSEEPSSERDPPRLDHHVPHPLQLVEGKTLMYDPREFDLWPLMVQLQGWSLELGTADVWGGGVEREAEAFSAACGFSAAFGPIVLKLVTTAVYGRVFAGGVSVLPMDHVVYAFGQYWEKEIGPRDATERFFKLVKEELRRFVLAIALRHPDLDALPPDNKSIYVDTVLTILFYKFRYTSRTHYCTLSRCR